MASRNSLRAVQNRRTERALADQSDAGGPKSPKEPKEDPSLALRGLLASIARRMSRAVLTITLRARIEQKGEKRCVRARESVVVFQPIPKKMQLESSTISESLAKL